MTLPWTSIRRGFPIKNSFVNVRLLNVQPKCVFIILVKFYYFFVHCRSLCCLLSFLDSLSNGGDRGLWVITAAAVRLWCLLAFACDKLITCCDELTSVCDESTAWRVDLMTSSSMTSWLCDELTGSLSTNCSSVQTVVTRGPLQRSWDRTVFEKSIKQLNRVSLGLGLVLVLGVVFGLVLGSVPLPERPEQFLVTPA